MKIAIYNDCDINSYKHFGCELVMETFREQLNRVDCELVGTVTRNRYNNKGHVKKILDKADLVIVNGEGSLHHNRRNDILSVGQKWNSILINTVFQANDGNGLKDFRYVSCRESYSANEAAKAGDINVDVIPDIIFTNKRLQKLKLIGDKEHAVIEHFKRGDISTNNNAEKFLNEMMRYRTISSVSFHSLIIAMILGQEIIKIIPTTTHKNDGLMKDYNSDENFISNSKEKINRLFERLHEWK